MKKCKMMEINTPRARQRVLGSKILEVINSQEWERRKDKKGSYKTNNIPGLTGEKEKSSDILRHENFLGEQQETDRR